MLSRFSLIPVALLRVAALLALGLAVSIATAQSTIDQQAQKPAEGAQQPANGGVQTGAPQAAVLDAQQRPITAGGFVKNGPVLFDDISGKSGLARWHHVMGTPAKTYILETLGSGVALLDYDNDGWLDIYLVNGSTYDAESGKAQPPHAALFHNNHDGTFTDVTEESRRRQRSLGHRRRCRGLRQRRLARYLRHQLRQEPPLSQQSRRHLYRCRREKAGVTLGNWSTGASWG